MSSRLERARAATIVAFRRVLATLMLAMTFVTLVDPRPRRARRPLPPWLLGVLFLALGFYGGFVQAGIGFLLLAVTTWAGLDLVRGNAVKVLNVLIVTIVAGLVFAATGNIRFFPDGSSTGGHITVSGRKLAYQVNVDWLTGAVNDADGVVVSLMVSRRFDGWVSANVGLAAAAGPLRRWRPRPSNPLMRRRVPLALDERE